MSTPRYLHTRERGFTLVELVMVIVILGVISSMVAVIMRGPIDAYFATARRAALTDLADTVFRRLERDLRKALPNSIRTPVTVPANQCLEFIPTKTGGRYRADNSAAGLSFTTADTSFNMLGHNSILPADQRIVAGDYIAISNYGPNQPGADAYIQDNTSLVTNVGTDFQNASPLGWETPITITSKLFPLASDSKRFHVIPAAEHVVSYVCSGNKLYRTANSTDFTSSCPTTGAVIATNVASCFFDNTGTDLARNALVRIVLQLKDGKNNEAVQLQEEVHVDNTP